MKRNRAKNEFLPLCTKYRALMHVERDCPKSLTTSQQAQAASNHVGHVISTRTNRRNYLSSPKRHLRKLTNLVPKARMKLLSVYKC